MERRGGAARVVSATLRLEARGLGHRFAAGRGLDPVDFAVEGPGVTAVTGENGSGKSTLLRIVAGLLRATHGTERLEVDGRTLPASGRRDAIGLASPDLAFYEELSVGENLEFAGEARGLAAPARAAGEALTRVGLESRRDDRVAALSSGMRQRLRLAFAVLHRPRWLLLDEPGGHLDDSGRATLERIVREHARDGHVLLATNDEREWRLGGQRIALRGRGLGHPA
ncbi:MAG TPA: ABC transporter ATP-binding protein [Candidatus Saccharimonadaceae bacterium]|nr:ABC transporter ATP-binding protein [Candidatus Saccharimonadaceae bacterium]